MNYLVIRDTPYPNGVEGTYPVIEITFDNAADALQYTNDHPGTRVAKVSVDPEYTKVSPYNLFEEIE